MKFKKYFFNFFKVFSLIIFIFYCLFKAVLLSVENKINEHFSTENNVKNETAIIHFIHGSIPLENCIYPRKRLGGLLGGHVEVELDGQIYGFRLSKLPVHIFPNNADFNAKYEVNTKEAWLKRTEYEKITSIHLPITHVQKNKLEQILKIHLIHVPYDYAFFGKRCASSTAEILSNSDIFSPLSNAEIMIAFLAPNPLRNTLINVANKQHFLINKKQGVDCRIWE